MKLKSNVNTADIFFTIIGPNTKEHHSIQYLMSKDLVFSNYFEYFIKYFFCPLKNWCFFKPVDFWKLRICVSVSNGTGQCNFSGQRDRSSFIVPGPWDNGTSSKCCLGTGWDVILTVCPVPSKDSTWDRRGKRVPKLKMLEKIFF